jgi:predicted ATPase
VEFANACDHPFANHRTRLEEAIHTFMATGARLRLPYYLSLLARAYHQAREDEKALKVIEQALNEALNNQERCWDSELYRLRGEFLLSQGGHLTESTDFAEAAFQRSREIARKQQALTFEIRATISLARLWNSGNRSQEASQLLTPILSRLTEGQDSLEAQSARSLLKISS